MPRQRSPAPSAVSSSSGASFHTAYESRRSMYPGMQARASDAGESEPSSSLRHEFPGILKEVHKDKDSEPSAHSSKAATSNSRYGPSVIWSDQSRASLSPYNLDPRDSINNQNYGSSGASGNSRIPRRLPPPRSSKPHTEDEYYDPKYGAWIKTVAPKGQEEHRASEVNRKDLLAYYSEQPGIQASHQYDSIDSRVESYDDAYVEPFAPRYPSDRDRNSGSEN